MSVEAIPLRPVSIVVSRLNEYSFIGPALFEMRNFPHNVGLVRWDMAGANNEPVYPHEVWCPINTTWVRLNGEWVSGYRGLVHFAFRPSLLNRIKIKMTARKWRKATGLAVRRALLEGNGDG